MSDAFMFWFLRGEPTAHLVDRLAATGAALAYPLGEGQVSVLDLEGAQRLVSREHFLSLLEGGEEPTLTFQIWYSRSEDVVVTIRRHLVEASSNAPFYSVMCYLDGLEGDQVDSAVSASEELVNGSPDEVVGVVIDRSGTTEDFDWEEFLRDPASVPPPPDRLIVRRAAVEGRDEGSVDWSLGVPGPEFATLVIPRN